MERAGSSGERWSIKNPSMISAYSATSWLISSAAALEGAAWWKLREGMGGGVTPTTQGIRRQYAVDGVCWIVSKMEKSEIIFSKQIAPPPTPR